LSKCKKSFSCVFLFIIFSEHLNQGLYSVLWSDLVQIPLFFYTPLIYTYLSLISIQTCGIRRFDFSFSAYSADIFFVCLACFAGKALFCILQQLNYIFQSNPTIYSLILVVLNQYMHLRNIIDCIVLI